MGHLLCALSSLVPFCLRSMTDLDDSEGPVVTGISPSAGLPGTKVTIRGENLGESKDDVIGMKAFCERPYRRFMGS